MCVEQQVDEPEPESFPVSVNRPADFCLLVDLRSWLGWTVPAGMEGIGEQLSRREIERQNISK